MLFSSASLAAATALAAFAAPAAGSPNGWSKTKEVPDGPTKLYDCPCKPIIDAMVKCQTRKGPNAGIRDCVCIPNPDGWYGYLNTCRDCLSYNPGPSGSGSGSDPFFKELAGTITQLFVSCTNVGGGVNSPDGKSICASNAMLETCASLKTGGKEASWASSKIFKSGVSTNGTFVVDIPGDPAMSASATPSSAANTTALSTGGGGGAATTAPGTQTTSTTPTPGATKPSSAMGYAGSRSQVGGIVGLVFAVGVAVLI
ncbi:hypothetical protein GGTG_08022 [Gaeumannomyces tritici R3-111a-1]|uniref:Uncharacterized protein n=1 Tax=Gaeumannomyces tritici (strain R3-111a-1) TaxID=644352 RepID=J3P3D5_GAET3|nr:hypothetical protein GGTG_08022 [Gaeumannomyces tritici R3-111a-1]EJT74177.1 hypothetical protein GGTG_08022 [Gaeumannomyces tritici R3-111a-1]